MPDAIISSQNAGLISQGTPSASVVSTPYITTVSDHQAVLALDKFDDLIRNTADGTGRPHAPPSRSAGATITYNQTAVGQVAAELRAQGYKVTLHANNATVEW